MQAATLEIFRLQRANQDEAFLAELGEFVAQLSRISRSEEHTSELQSQSNLVCRLLLEKKNILARALEVPCVVGAGQASEIARDGDLIALDGSTGEVLVSPDPEEVKRFDAARAAARSPEAALLEDRDLPAQTLDGRRVYLLANIEFPEEVPSVLAHGGEGGGLYRTEVLYPNPEEPPTQEEPYRASSTILERMKDFPVTIPTLDLGGDKLPIGHRSHEPTPALGLRAI